MSGESAADALARLYDLDLADDPGDLDLFLALAARTGGPVLELAVGTGRLAVPLAASGYDVTGVDLDPAMLARARTAAGRAGAKAAARLDLVEGDARTVRLAGAGGYRLAAIPLNSIFLLGTRGDQADAALTLAAALHVAGAPPIWRPAASPSSTPGCPMPTTCRATTVASSSSGCARSRAPGAP